MKLQRIWRAAGVMLAASLLAGSAAARPKIRSVQGLAQALAAKLPRRREMVVFVAPPGWKGKHYSYPLAKRICSELARDLSAADPSALFLTPATAAGILARHGFLPLDSYYAWSWRLSPPHFMPSLNSIEAQLGDLVGAQITIAGQMRRKSRGIALTVEAMETKGRRQRMKRIAKVRAFLPSSPRLRALLAQAGKPIEGDSGVYWAGLGGVGQPHCISCVSPQYTAAAARDMVNTTVLLLATVGTDGKVSDVVLLRGAWGQTGPGLDRNAIAAVKTWKLRPPKGPDGKPVPIRLTIQITFMTGSMWR